MSVVFVLILACMYSYNVAAADEIRLAAEQHLDATGASPIDFVFHPMDNYH